MTSIITPGVIACQGEVCIQIHWSDKKLLKAQRSDAAGQRLWGADRWAALKRRIRTLESADTLADVRGQAGKFHALSADLAGEWAANLTPNWRVVFEPADEPLPTLVDGGLDTAKVTAVRIRRIEDYHGH
jgi:toxin HigB-1